MPVHPRRALLRELQTFFEVHMQGLYRWVTAGEADQLPPRGTVRLRAPEKHEKVPGRRQLDKEVAAVDFDGYALVVSSPDEKPPLGEILLFHPNHGELRGPIDPKTWELIARAIKINRNEDDNEPRRSDASGYHP